MPDWFVYLAIGFCVLYWLRQSHRQRRRRRIGRRSVFILQYRFPVSVFQAVKEKYPHPTEDNLKEVESGLRDYFQLCARSGKRMVSMPSQVVDVAWHEFILFTRDYAAFCDKAFGRFLHHTPAEAMASQQQAGDGIRRAWRLACLLAGTDPTHPHTLPRLFKLDAKLRIPDGFIYQRYCEPHKQTGRAAAAAAGGAVIYCASHIGCGGAASGAGALWFGAASDGCSADFDASGCGGDSGGGGGCGGGCGGD